MLWRFAKLRAAGSSRTPSDTCRVPNAFPAIFLALASRLALRRAAASSRASRSASAFSAAASLAGASCSSRACCCRGVKGFPVALLARALASMSASMPVAFGDRVAPWTADPEPSPFFLDAASCFLLMSRTPLPMSV